MRKHNFKGFTLIELLVVISIIAVLMAILMPSLKKARNQSRTVVCQSNLTQWGKFFYLYTEDNEGNFMEWKESFEPGGGTWIVPMMAYYGKDSDAEMRLCPTTRKTAKEGEIDPARSAWSTVVDGIEHKNSYGINNWCYKLPKGRDDIWGAPNAKRRAWQRIDQQGSANIPMFLECWRWGIGVGSRSNQAPPDDDKRYDGFGRSCLNRHAHTINVTFLDGSCRRIRLKHLWDLKWHREYDLSDPLPEWPEWMASLPD